MPFGSRANNKKKRPSKIQHATKLKFTSPKVAYKPTVLEQLASDHKKAENILLQKHASELKLLRKKQAKELKELKKSQSLEQRKKLSSSSTSNNLMMCAYCEEEEEEEEDYETCTGCGITKKCDDCEWTVTCGIDSDHGYCEICKDDKAGICCNCGGCNLCNKDFGCCDCPCR